MKKTFILISLMFFLLTFEARAEEGDFFFAPEVGWAHIFSDAFEEGVYAGAHLGYDTSDNLSIELVFFYGDNNGQASGPDLRYVLGGGGLSYKFFIGKFKPSLFAGASIVGLDYSTTGKVFKGGLYCGAAVDYYLNKIVSIGLSYKYFPVIKAQDAGILGFRFGFEF